MTSQAASDRRRILEFLRHVHRRWTLYVAGRWSLTALTALLGLFWVLVAVEHWVGLPVALRVAIPLVTAAGFTLALIVLSRLLWGQVPHRRRAIEVERFAPHLREQLITAVEIGEPERARDLGYAGWLVDLTVKQAREKIEKLDLRGFWKGTRVAVGAKWLAAGIAVTAVLTLAFRAPAERALYAVAHPTEELPRPAPFDWTVVTGPDRILQYETVELAARAHGSRPPASARLLWRYEDGSEWFVQELTGVRDSDGVRFAHVLSSVPQSVNYRFEGDGRESEINTVRVNRRPELVAIEARCEPPAYTAVKPYALDAARSRWTVPEGSAVTITATSDRPLDRGYIAARDSSQVPLEIDGRSGTARIVARSAQEIRVFVVDTAGLENFDPVPIEIETVPDLAPQIALLEPGGDQDIPEAMMVHMAAALLDDYGLSRLDIIYVVMGEEGDTAERTLSLTLPRDFGREGVFEFDWALMDLRLFPGDRVMYRARVYDNHRPDPRWAETPSYVLRMPTLDEIIAETEENQARRTDEVTEAVRKQQELATELRDMARQLVGRENVEWENRQQLEGAIATQEKLAENLQKWADEIEKEAEQLAASRMASLELIQKMNEVSRLLQEVMTPELQEQLEKLRQAMEAMTPEEMRQAIEDFQMSEEEILAQLDRALAQLRQMQLEQMMENILRLAERLAESQEAQNRAAENAPDQRTLDSLARAEEALRDQLRELQEQAQKLSEKNQEAQSRADVELFAQTAGMCQAGGNMEEMARRMQSGDKSQASQSGQRASKQLREMLSALQQQMMEMRNQMSAEQMAALQDLTRRSLALSEEEEGLGDSTHVVSQQSLALRDMARRQAALTAGIQTLLEDFDQQAKENLFLSPDVRRHLSQSSRSSESATGSLTQRQGPTASAFQYETMFSLNEATRSLMESLDNQKQCQGSASGQGQIHSGMQNLSQQQLQLNQETQSMRNPYGLTPEQQESARRLAGQQHSIQQQMRDLADQFTQSRDRLGRVDEIARSMEEVVEGLESGQISEETLERQRNIYNRMLDFQKSLQRQDFENRRQSRRGTDLAGRPPDPLGPAQRGDADDRERWERFRNEWYPPGFRALVKEYFESVARREAENP